ncbi:hypothetical protein QTI66_37975 [Variovorax sp. J22R133]|uniref:hypothetical protein n=1 Tax=Variovorax brevis TaxID=3053503 RepID=UPI002576C839|nr:hypothetical protein [Variovorax sp. J22R133]MDM0117882.1 hypothetical protein [Variovorax sp. J22R133]
MTQDTTRPAPPRPNTEARLGDRGDASGRNIQQNRAIGQDDPMKGSRMGREANKKSGAPGEPEVETNDALRKKQQP